VIGGERDLGADLLAHRGHPVGQERDALVRDLDARERMHHERAARRRGARGHGQGARHVLEQVDAEVLLEERESHVHARLQAAALLVGLIVLRRVGV
jgi:hypothetical protein